MSIFDVRLNLLRAEMKKLSISYYIVTTDDYHGSEYVGEYFKCREFLSGFTGSAGTLLVGLNDAYLYTDGRYFIQAEKELSISKIKLMKSGEKDVPVLSDLLKGLVKSGETVGFDGRCVSIDFYNTLKSKLSGVNFDTIHDLCDLVWKDRHDFPVNQAWELDIKFAGEGRRSKLYKLREYLRRNSLKGMFISALDETNWLLNIRGNDIAYCPMCLSYVYVDSKNAYLFANKGAFSDSLVASLKQDGVEILSYASAYSFLENIKEKEIAIDFRKSNVSILKALSRTQVINVKSPIEYDKAIKNEIEIENIKKAHVTDGVAFCRFLYKLYELEKSGELWTNAYTEKGLEQLLLSYRSKGEDFIEESFAPIIATGEHGAIVHYEATEESDIPIQNNTLLLMDTGGHYSSGTTDITRTICLGTPSAEMVHHYTLVLKGHIDLAIQVFKEGTTGKELDCIARKPLHDVGLDFNHGTGHGVGYLLNVHEGPQNISYRSKCSVEFKPGMITSDEPGLYFEGKYGIRTENMILCKKHENEGFLCFEPLTLVPYDKKLIDKSMLTVEEIAYLDYYNECVFEKLKDYLEDNERTWLQNHMKLD